ncbi:MAG: protease modulator HflC [Bacillota bacterium]|nr:protease modulator HflC [Bacillota bacterium]
MDFNNNEQNRQNFQDINAKTQQIKQKAIKNAKNFSFLLIIILLLLGAKSFIYTVAEDEVAVVSVLGDIKKVIVDKDNTLAIEQNDIDSRFSNVEIVNKKGLFFKIPFITTINKTSSKLITYQSNSANIVTKDKIKYKVALYAQWEISHPGLFKTSLGTINKANAVIDEVVYAVIIEKINTLTSDVFLTDKDRIIKELEESKINLNGQLASKGIVLRDIEIYRTILPDSNIESTHQKMVAERQAVAQKTRSEGKELYRTTVAKTDRQVKEIESAAIEEAEMIKGSADAEALEIYANAYSKDPEFYEFYKSLESYKTSFDEQTTIFLDKNNPYLKYFNNN